jgi:acyl-CoA thioesterase
MSEFPRPSDADLLFLEFDPDYSKVHFELVPGLARHDGGLYGGTAIAVSVAAMEAATQRGVLWITTQYVATAQLGNVVECSVDVLASGRDISQVQVTGRSNGQVMFVSIGSTATPRPGGFAGQFQTMPLVSAPEDSELMNFEFGRPGDIKGFGEQVEYLGARTLGPPESAPTMALWARVLGGHAITPAAIAFVADMVPPAVVRASGMFGGGISLDNALRFGPIPDGLEWVLLDLRGVMSHGAHGHGTVAVWSPDGHLLAIGGQSTNVLFVFTREQVDQMTAEGKGFPDPTKPRN